MLKQKLQMMRETRKKSGAASGWASARGKLFDGAFLCDYNRAVMNKTEDSGHAPGENLDR